MPLGVRVEVEDGNAKVFLSGLAERLEARRLLPIFGEVMQTSIDETFEAEGYPAGSWRLLNASSILQSFTRRGKSATTKAGRQRVGFLRFASGKKILQDTAALRNSIQNEIQGDKLIIGTALKYARIHQEGGVIQAKPGKVLRIPIGAGRVIFRPRVTIPARPYLLIKPGDAEKMAQAAEDFLAADGGAR